MRSAQAQRSLSGSPSSTPGTAGPAKTVSISRQAAAAGRQATPSQREASIMSWKKGAVFGKASWCNEGAGARRRQQVVQRLSLANSAPNNPLLHGRLRSRRAQGWSREADKALLRTPVLVTAAAGDATRRRRKGHTKFSSVACDREEAETIRQQWYAVPAPAYARLPWVLSSPNMVWQVSLDGIVSA